MKNKKEILLKKNTKNRVLLFLNLVFLSILVYGVNKNSVSIFLTLLIIAITIFVTYYLFIQDQQIIVYEDQILLKNKFFNRIDWEISAENIKYVQISYLRDTLISKKLLDFYSYDNKVLKCCLEGLTIAELEIIFRKMNLKVIKKILRPRDSSPDDASLFDL